MMFVNTAAAGEGVDVDTGQRSKGLVKKIHSSKHVTYSDFS